MSAVATADISYICSCYTVIETTWTKVQCALFATTDHDADLLVVVNLITETPDLEHNTQRAAVGRNDLRLLQN